MNYKKLNVYTGWLVFLISTIVYFLTLEDTVSLWDCGEYITAAYKLEVGHPPGAPLFMLLGRLFSLFTTDAENVAVWINRMSAVSSSATILFMFWSITLLVKKMAQKTSRELNNGQIIAIIGSGLVGSLAYTFTDSFWFSAVEGEVYAMSSLFTALIFWAILKWDEEMDAIKHGELAANFVPMRWMILIMFLFGLAIGVHLLGLLVVPAIAYVIYFNQWKDFTWKGFFLTGIISIFVLGFIQEGIIPGTISLASKFEVAFVNSMGMPFYVGSMFFFILLIALSIFLVRWSKKNNKPLVNAAALGFIVFLIGYGSFATIVIRSNANTPLDENDPENLVTLHAYLKREQYGSWPILNGPYWNSKYASQDTWGDRSKFYARRFVVTRGEQDLKAFREEKNALAYAKNLGNSYEVVEKYFVTNEGSRENQEPRYEQTTFFPRMFWDQDDAKVEGYKDWSNYNANGDDPTAEKGKDGKRLPTFGENMTYFASYQINWMYWRYFMWNFAGRQNDIQGHGDNMRGNWISGFSSIDSQRLGDQANAPTFTTENPSNNRFYFLPLIIGLIGMFFHFYKSPKDAFVVLLTFFFTGLAIVVYLNQKPFEPRERDYAYAASFYVFAIWIGVGVYALYEIFKSFSVKEYRGFGFIVGGGLLFSLVIDALTGGFAASSTWLLMSGIAAVFIVGMNMLGKTLKSETSGAYLAVVLTLVVPVILAVQGWDDHNRSGKTTARDLAYNYLESCTKNSILFTNGDNDTFPLWYLQEVEEKRTDVRVCNLSLMQTDWYTEQMMMKAYDSDPLPIKFKEDQIMMFAGNTDQVYFLSMIDLLNAGLPEENLKKIIEAKIKNNQEAFKVSYNAFKQGCAMVSKSLTAKDPSVQSSLTEMQNRLSATIENPGYADVKTLLNDCIEILSGASNGMLEGPQEALQQFQQNMREWENSWDYLPLADAMEFVRDDKNMISNEGRQLRVFPSKGFILPVNVENAVKSGLITEKEKASAEKELRFRIDKQAITREQVMMLDILANNDWKRNIYFSSPGGSDVSIALYQVGYVKQNGMVFEVSPIRNQEIIAKDKMYKNLMEVYEFGKMNQKGVLTDYYARRHTSQYRDHFSRLADAYLREADELKFKKETYGPQITRLRDAGNKKTADSLANVINGADGIIAKNKKYAINLIKKSIEVMPVDLVIDYGEPQPSRDNFEVSPGVSFEGYSDGVLHDYVGILYRAGDKAAAEKLGADVAKHIESVFTYYEKSDAEYAAVNKMDLISALNNYLALATFAADKEFGNPNGPLSARTNKKINELYNKTFPKIYSALKDQAIENGESVRPGSKSGTYAARLNDLKGHIDAVGMKYGFIDKPVQQMKTPGGDQGMQLTPEQIQMLMQQQQGQ
jgi:flagellar biogenesis protein FliO